MLIKLTLRSRSYHLLGKKKNKSIQLYVGIDGLNINDIFIISLNSLISQGFENELI